MSGRENRLYHSTYMYMYMYTHTNTYIHVLYICIKSLGIQSFINHNPGFTLYLHVHVITWSMKFL